MLTTAQRATFAAAVLAETNPTFVQARNIGDTVYMSNFYNALAAPQVMLWRPKIEVAELLGAVDWAEFVNAGISNQNAWFALTQGEYIDATQARIRAGFASVFGGGSTSVSNLAAIAQRPATRLEALFTTNNVCAIFGQLCSSTLISDVLGG